MMNCVLSGPYKRDLQALNLFRFVPIYMIEKRRLNGIPLEIQQKEMTAKCRSTV
jgi:hypothetical protein